MTIKSDVKTVWKGTEIKVAGKKVVGKTAYEIGLIVEGHAKQLAPKDTGYLAASITTQAYGGKGTVPEAPSRYGSGKRDGGSSLDMMIQSPREENEVLVGTPLFYGPYNEFGTIRSAAQPFLRPALDLAKGKTLTILESEGRFYFAEYMK